MYGATVEQLLDDFAGPMCRGDLQVRFDSLERTNRHDVLVGGVYTATLPLRAVMRVQFDKLALRHAESPADYITEYLNMHIKPFGKRLERASCAALDAWQAVIEP